MVLCVWYDRKQPYGFYVLCPGHTAECSMNTMDSNISPFILSKRKQLFKNVTEIVVFSLVICIYFHCTLFSMS